MRIYGVIDRGNCHIDVCKTEKGSKRFATNNGYNTVSCRNEYNVTIVAKKINGKWVKQ